MLRVEATESGSFVPRLKIKREGLVDLGSFASARLASVAHDVARLVYIHEKRPTTDLRVDNGLNYPADGYLCDPAFNQLLDSGTSFHEVCSLLRSGALADTFLVARGTERQTRAASSSSGGGGSGPSPPAAAPLPRQPSRLAAAALSTAARLKPEPAAAPQKQQQQQQQQRPDGGTTKALPLNPSTQPPADTLLPPAAGSAAAAPPPPLSPFASTSPPASGTARPAPTAVAPAAATPVAAAAAVDEVDDASPFPCKKRPMRWLEWPTKGGGQYATCISERALKNNMTLPCKMKRELFQVTGAHCPIAAHDLQPGSGQRWSWEVRDYVKDERTSTYIYNLAAFFKHYDVAAGDVMVVVASAPGAVKATVWRGDSEEALQFKAQQDKLDKNSRSAGGGSGGGSNAGTKKRPAEAPPRQQAPPKVPKPAATAPVPAAASATLGAASAACSVPARSAGAPAAGGAMASKKGQRQQVPPAAQAAAPVRADSSKQQPVLSTELSRPISKSASGPAAVQQQQTASVQKRQLSQQEQEQQQQQQQKAAPAPLQQQRPAQQRPAQQRSQPAQQQPQAVQQQRSQQAQQADELLALADAGVDASHPSPSGGDDTMHLSPTAHVAQSPYRHQQLALPPLASVAIKVEPQQQQQHEQQPATAAEAVEAAAAAAAAVLHDSGGGGGAATAAALSPARMSCADASPTCHQQQELQGQTAREQQQQQVSGVQDQQQQGQQQQQLQLQQDLPDALSIANNEGAVYVGMSRLLSLITITGRVPAEAVSAYRRSFGRLEPAGRRWFHYDSLKQLVDAGEWEDVHQWLRCN